MPHRPDSLRWRSWVSRHFTPTAVVVVGGTLALVVAASDYRDHRQAQRDTQAMYQGLVDGLGAIARLQYEIQEAWLWGMVEYKTAFDSIKRLSPTHYRAGKRLT